MNKTPKYVIVEHKSNINTVLKNTCQFSQRIKFTCFDVSLNYLVFGATSGGAYVFKRYPHILIKLIPNKHGTVVLLAISPNEKSIALATSRGVIVILTNCLASSDFQYHTYFEDKENLITAIKWNNNDELYYGNTLGKVAIITVPNLLAKAIFQTPCASLMQLDSSVCQIDCYSKLLLVSTFTRTYLCDTEKEQFVQIGKKLRSGSFGSCFFTDAEPEKLCEDEQIISNSNDSVKIFCNRPGARIWEVRPDATVTYTHQLKHLLKEKLDGWICLNDENDPHSNIIHLGKLKTESQESLNFTKILVLQNTFIFTFNTEGFYIFDPETLTVIYRYNNLNSIKEVKIARNFIYICLENMEVHIFALHSLENIILKTLFNQQYHACLQICVKYHKEVLELIETSERLYLLTALENKLCQCFTGKCLVELKLIFTTIQYFSRKRLSEKQNNGIVIVNNTHFNDEFSNTVLSIEKPKENGEHSDHLGNNCTENHKDLQDNDTYMKTLFQQYEWSRINKGFKLSKYKDLLHENGPDQVTLLFQNFDQFMLDKAIDTNFWSYSSYLKYFSSLDYEKLIMDSEIDTNSIEFLLKCYSVINDASTCSCTCSYPLPSAKIKKPQFYNVGCAIIKKLWKTNRTLFDKLVNDVPFMWKYVIEHLRNEDDIDVLLPILMQFNDEDLFIVFLNKFKYDTWDSAIRILIKLQENKCINCETKFVQDCNSMKWKQLASLIIQSIGAQSTVNLLKHYAPYISSEDLDATFYKNCIFSTAFGNFSTDSKNQFLSKAIDSSQTELEFDELIAKYLTEKYKANHTHYTKGVPLATNRDY